MSTQRALQRIASTNKQRQTGNEIAAPGAAALAEALKKNSTLTDLHMHRNAIGDAGAEALAAALETNQGLQHLTVSDNKIGGAGVAAFGNALKHNTTLKELSLTSLCPPQSTFTKHNDEHGISPLKTCRKPGDCRERRSVCCRAGREPRA